MYIVSPQTNFFNFWIKRYFDMVKENQVSRWNQFSVSDKFACTLLAANQQHKLFVKVSCEIYQPGAPATLAPWQGSISWSMNPIRSKALGYIFTWNGEYDTLLASYHPPNMRPSRRHKFPVVTACSSLFSFNLATFKLWLNHLQDPQFCFSINLLLLTLAPLVNSPSRNCYFSPFFFPFKIF